MQVTTLLLEEAAMMICGVMPGMIVSLVRLGMTSWTAALELTFLMVEMESTTWQAERVMILCPEA